VNVASPEPGSCALAPIGAREIPDDLAEKFRTRPDIVEELSDGLRQRGIESSVDLAGYVTNRDRFVHAGPVLTVRYAPKRVKDNEQRLGHAQIGAAAIPGCVVLSDARGCDGSVLGGNAAVAIRAGGAAVYVLDGLARDIDEISATGLIVIAAEFGIRSGRPTAQAIAIGEPMTFLRTYVASGDVAVVNRNGLVVVPSWVAWDDVRAMI
jgi:regulator of RNase E activity RraA